MKSRFFVLLSLVALVALGFAGVVAADVVRVDVNLQRYTEGEPVSGNIKSVGSDTMNNLMTLWAEAFKGFYPNISVEIEGKGSSTAPPALIEKVASFGPMSRRMKSGEVDDFEKRFGYKPTQLKTSIDMLAVYVHKDNPIKGLSLRQIDSVYSKGRKGGYPRDIRTWGDVGLTGAWKDRPITLYGRNSASGTYGYFKKHALFRGDYKDSVKEQPGSSAVVSSVAHDIGGIGYSGIGYRTADVRAIALSRKGTDYIPAQPEFAYSNKYPLARFLWLAVDYKPGSRLDPLRREFLKLIFSRQGQQVVVKDGYLPISARLAAQQLAAVGLRHDS